MAIGKVISGVGSVINIFSSAYNHSYIGVLKLDALLSESINLSCNVSQYPSENGFRVSDNVSVEPEKIVITGVVTGLTNIPLVDIIADAGKPKLTDAIELLRNMADEREPITITTGLGIYENYAVESISIERNVDDGEQLNVEVSCVKIRYAVGIDAELPESVAKADVSQRVGATKNTGTQSKKNAIPSSDLKAGIDTVRR